MAPDFALQNQRRELVRLSNYRGRKVLLFAYPKAGTRGGTVQACGFRDNFSQIETANAVVLGISPDAPADLAKWIEAESPPYDLLSDPDHQTLEAWQAWGERSMYGKTYQGVIRSHWIIDEDGRCWTSKSASARRKASQTPLKLLDEAE